MNFGEFSVPRGTVKISSFYQYIVKLWVKNNFHVQSFKQDINSD